MQHHRLPGKKAFPSFKPGTHFLSFSVVETCGLSTPWKYWSQAHEPAAIMNQTTHQKAIVPSVLGASHQANSQLAAVQPAYMNVTVV
jgi:hypothetical protein